MSELDMTKTQAADLRNVSSPSGLCCDAPSAAPDSSAVDAFRLAMENEERGFEGGKSCAGTNGSEHFFSPGTAIPDEEALHQFSSLFSMPASAFAVNGTVGGSAAEQLSGCSPLADIDLEMLVDRILVSASDIGRHEVRLTLSGHVLGGTEIVLQRSLEGMLIVTLQCTDISSFQTLVASQMELKARLEDYENRSVQVSVDIDKERNDTDRRSRGYTEQEPQEA